MEEFQRQQQLMAAQHMHQQAAALQIQQTEAAASAPTTATRKKKWLYVAVFNLCHCCSACHQSAAAPAINPPCNGSSHHTHIYIYIRDAAQSYNLWMKWGF